MSSALERINIKRYEWNLCRFCFAWDVATFWIGLHGWKSFALCTTNRIEKIMHCVGKKEIMDRYFPCHIIWLYIKLACTVEIPARFNKRKQNKRYGEKTIPLVFYVDMFVGKYSRKQSNRGGGTKNGEQKSPTRTFFILHRETILEAPPRFELGIKVLQTFALPLGYGTIFTFYYM